MGSGVERFLLAEELGVWCSTLLTSVSDIFVSCGPAWYEHDLHVVWFYS